MTVPFVTGTPTVAILSGVAHTRARTGDQPLEQAMSVRTLQAYRDRINLALERYANGEADIIVD